jgi:hypothetical protein
MELDLQSLFGLIYEGAIGQPSQDRRHLFVTPCYMGSMAGQRTPASLKLCPERTREWWLLPDFVTKAKGHKRIHLRKFPFLAVLVGPVQENIFFTGHFFSPLTSNHGQVVVPRHLSLNKCLCNIDVTKLRQGNAVTHAEK